MSGVTSPTLDSPSGFFCCGVAVFAEGGFVANRAAATKAGWLETQRNGVREFICPGCQP